MAVSHTPARPRHHARAARATLTRERVVEAAVDLLDRAGPGEFTMRVLARRLGVAPMTLYSHFSGKDEIIDAVRLRLLAEADLPGWDPAGPPPDPREEVRDLCRAVHRLLAGHPSVLRLLAERPVGADEANRFTDRVLAALLRAGLGRHDAARAYTALVQFTMGAALWAQHRAGRRPPGEAARPERYPVAADLAPELAGAVHQAPEQFAFGLDALLTGLLGPARAAPAG